MSDIPHRALIGAVELHCSHTDPPNPPSHPIACPSCAEIVGAVLDAGYRRIEPRVLETATRRAAPAPDYEWRGQVTKWVDGDTVDIYTDRGMKDWSHKRYRLFRIDTPERGEIDYVRARLRCEELAPVGTWVTMRTFKPSDAFGRYLADIFVGDLCINDVLLAEGLAVIYED